MIGEIRIRDAVAADAAAACEVLRRSIIELCGLDHRDDPAILRQWLANKTPENVGAWITNPNASLLLAVDGAAILGVGGVTDGGEITLLYVSPDARFRGVSRALLGALERRAAERGNIATRLISSATARRFYHAAFYAETGPPEGKFGTSGSWPMTKNLLSIAAICDRLPEGFEVLQEEARAEGYRFLDRLSADWAADAMRFAGPGETLLAVHSARVPAAIGGLTQDPTLPDTLRMRRFYVRPLFRRRGVARRLAELLLQAAARTGLPVVLNAASSSVPFWESLGFVPDARDGHTHRLAQRQS